MTDRAAFVAAIEADPDSDLPRLVFADWLEDHGDPERAELIRVQCEYAVRPTVALGARAKSLSNAHVRRFFADLPGHLFTPPLAADWDRFLLRGFLHGLPLSARDLAAVVAWFAGREPLLGYSLSLDRGDPPVADGPHLRNLVYIAGGFGLLPDSPHLCGLGTVGTWATDEVDRLAAAVAPFRLRFVRLTSAVGRDDWDALAARLLARTPRFASLEQLSIWSVGFRAAAVRELIASPHLSPTLLLNLDGYDQLRPGSALARDVRARFPGPAAVG